MSLELIDRFLPNFELVAKLIFVLLKAILVVATSLFASGNTPIDTASLPNFLFSKSIIDFRL